MKKVILIPALFLALAFGACNNNSESDNKNAKETVYFDTTKLKAGEFYYQCEMHADVISDKPGKCPKCGEMELSKVEKK